MYLKEQLRMYEVTIDTERCKKDGLCAMICPVAVIQQDEQVIGADPILHGAPVSLAFHARRTVGFGDVNAQLALQNASLVAHALDVGHFYTDWVLATCRAPMARAWNRRMPGRLGISPNNNLYGALALGYPIPKFENMIERKPPIIRWA